MLDFSEISFVKSGATVLYSCGVVGFGAEIVEELGDALFAVGVLAEGIDDPYLSQVYGGG